MCSARKRKKFSAIALTAAAIMFPAAAMAGVVVKSSGPSADRFAVGTKLDDDSSITLREGDTITVLTSKGTRVLRGAGSFRVGDRATVTKSRFSALTRKRAASRVRTGAVRPVETGGPILSPNLWYVDVTRGGTVCLYDLETVRLWRPGIDGASTYVVSDLSSADHLHVTFADGEMVTALDPERMPLAEGGNYRLSKLGGADSVDVQFVSLEGDFDRADLLAEALIEKGCTMQLGLLADNLSAAAD